MASGGTVLAGGTWLLPPCAAGGVFAPWGMLGMGSLCPIRAGDAAALLLEC